MTLEHATHTTYKITRFDSEEWLNYNKKERSKPLKNEPNCLKPVKKKVNILNDFQTAPDDFPSGTVL